MAYTTIKNPGLYFNTKLWTGTGANLSITGVGFQPDFTWIKNRANTDDHNLFDVLRGFSTDALLRSNTNGAATDTTEGIKSFDSDGFSLGTNGSSNGNGQGMVSWNWKAETAFSNNAGANGATIASSGKVNTTAGFSIVSFVGNQTSGATVAHGLGAVPKVVIIKGRDSALDWRSYFAPLGAGKYMVLNGNDAVATNTNFMNDTSPTSSVFSLGNGTTPNKSGENYIAYCFAEKTGYSKFGSYVGNGNANGPFIYTGFKPTFVISKNTSITQHWSMNDTKRDPFNVGNKRLWPSQSTAEVSDSGYYIDYLSNGFKIRSNSSSWNGSGNTIIYMAFAEQPLIGDNPATAR